MENFNYIKQGDCLELMREMPDDIIDLTVTSPPYDNLRTYNGNISQWTFKKFQEIAKELYRITKPGGVVVWVVADATIKGSETGTSFRQALYFKEVGFNLHDTMIWIKDGGGAIGSKKCYIQNFEYMLVLSKDYVKHSNIIKDKPNLSAGKLKKSCQRREKDGTRNAKETVLCDKFSRRNNWWYIPTQKCGEHPAVFPLQLATDHIISWSEQGDIVFDPFLGSGTTAVACINTNRHYIGFELDESYFNIAKQRIENNTVRAQQ